MDFKEVLSKERSGIEKEIESYMDMEISASLDDEYTRQILKSIKEFTLRGGKRVRSLLVTMGYRGLGGRDIERARRASISLELIQTMLLIHDDIIDESPERRGAPSFHKEMEDIHRELGYRGDPEKFGRNIAVIAGDLAESLGEKALVRSGFPPENLHKALEIQADMIRDTGLGQILDIYSEALQDWSEDMVLKVQKYKTARYTLEGPLHIGAALKGASTKQMDVLSRYAIPVGVAFQIIDDILGFYGDPKRGGKEDLADIKEGKRTLLIVKARELVSDQEWSKIEGALGNDDLSVAEAEEIRSIIRGCGSEKYSRDAAVELSKSGIHAIEDSDLDPDVIGFLKDLASYLLKRA